MTTRKTDLASNRRAVLKALGVAPMLSVFTGCQDGNQVGDGDDSGQPAATPAPAPAPTTAPTTARTFVHPGLLHTEADFARMREKVAAQAQPWLDGWTALQSSGRSQLGGVPRPLATVVRGGDGSNFAQLYIDIARSYQLALRWKVSGDTRYADRAVVFLNAWSSTLTSITGNADRYLAAGIYGWQFANAAEIMRTYPGWAASDFKRFQQMMLEVFYPLSSRFLREHNDAVITNYWANWDQCAMACVLAVGVLCDREDLYDEATHYYRHGQGNGAGLQAVYHVHPGYLGQAQESGRDQGHATLGVGLAGAFMEMAWNQGDDFYSYDNRRYLSGVEYVAKSNLKDASGAFYSLPYLRYANKQGVSTGVSAAGQGSMRPVFESVLHHYEGRLGVAAAYTRQMALQMRPESDGGNGDQLGFGSLTFARDAVLGGSPSGLTARRRASQVELSWWGTPDAVSYNVKRATRAGGPYTVVANGIGDLLTWTDAAPAGSLWYVVTAVNATGESGASNEVAVSMVPQLSLHLKFDEGAGLTVADATGRWPASQVTKAAGWTAGRGPGAAWALDGVNDHVTLPAEIVKDLSDFTIAAWVYLDAATRWARIFDIGSGPRRAMFLTACNAAGVAQFTIDTEHGYVAEGITGNAALPTGTWTHVAVTLSGSVGTLYVNGLPVGSNPDMHFAPYRLGVGMDGWIGRSQYTTDPFLKGKIDDFRLYQGALDAAAMSALAAA
ncbi:LamG-like jellyroll fold domain-containing protein [Roseateles sp. BYS96W]|uniref:LamG-like jellyroll fold domain-containing protein n=1 Tax=Pelomonas nitida TaxID=3299027 RepID=A0ABW7GBP6_9BURK